MKRILVYARTAGRNRPTALYSRGGRVAPQCRVEGWYTPLLGLVAGKPRDLTVIQAVTNTLCQKNLEVELIQYLGIRVGRTEIIGGESGRDSNSLSPSARAWRNVR